MEELNHILTNRIDGNLEQVLFISPVQKSFCIENAFNTNIQGVATC